MEDNRNNDEEANVTNGFSTVLSSSNSVTASPNVTDSNETNTTDLPSTSGYRPLVNSTTNTIHSTSSLTSFSDGTISDLTSDSLTPVTLSQSMGSDYSGTRFVVKRMESSELQSPPTSSGDSKFSEESRRASSQSPKSVKFIDEGDKPGPSKVNSQKEKGQSSAKIQKSQTTSALTHLDDIEPRQLVSPKSQDSFPSKEEIELPVWKRGMRSVSHDDLSEREEIVDECVDECVDEPNVPLLTPNPTTQSLDVRRPDGTVDTLLVEEIPNTPTGTSSAGTSTVTEPGKCKAWCNKYFWHIFAFIVTVIVTFTCTVVGSTIHYLTKSNATTNDTLIYNVTTPLTRLTETTTAAFTDNATTTDDIWTTEADWSTTLSP